MGYLWGVPIIRIIIFWGVYWGLGSPYFGKLPSMAYMPSSHPPPENTEIDRLCRLFSEAILEVQLVGFQYPNHIATDP